MSLILVQQRGENTTLHSLILESSFILPGHSTKLLPPQQYKSKDNSSLKRIHRSRGEKTNGEVQIDEGI
jgi:hypothetical protein